MRFLLVCLGGAAGTGARYLLGGWAAATFGSAFPYGTLGINALGSFLISAIMHVGLVAGAISPDLRIVLATGIMGGFTTYSSFNYEVLSHFQRGAFLLATAYLAATVVGCLICGYLGLALARWIVPV